MKKKLYTFLIFLFGTVFVLSTVKLGTYFWDTYRQESRYEDLAALMEAAPTAPRPQILPDSTEPAPTEPVSSLVELIDPISGDTVSLLPKFVQLYSMNSDIVGWLQIPGTKISYPVMQTPDSPDYYLHRNFDKEANDHGCLYAREVCNVLAPSDNITIYGHRMRDGSMFAQLENYRDPEFFRANPYIYFDTLQQLHTYQVLAVLLTTGETSIYHTFVDAADAQEFDTFIARCKAASLYDTGITAGYGDKLITLFTCEYTQTSGRLVVIAKQIA